MNLILPSDVYPPRSGGAGWSAHALALALAAQGHRIIAVVPREGASPRTRRMIDGIPVVEVGYRAPKIPILRNYFRHERLWPILAAAIEEASRQEPVAFHHGDTETQRIQLVKTAQSSVQLERGVSVIHAQHVQSVPAALRAGRHLGLPVVATVRDHWPWDYFATGLHGDYVPYDQQTWASLATDLVARLGPLPGTLAISAVPYLLAHLRRRAAALAACDAVVAVSGYIARRLDGIVAPERVHIIPNMVDLAATDTIVAQPGKLTPGVPFLLFVGKLEHNKGAQLLPAILAAARAALPMGHPALEQVVIAGNGSLRPQLERELGALGVQASFLEWAPHNEVLRLMARCTALLFPSSWGEPLSRVLLEAAACAAPILAMPSGGTPEIVVDGVSGALEASPEALGHRLATLLAHPTALQPLGAAARLHAEQQFAAPIIVRRFEALYASLAMELSG